MSYLDNRNVICSFKKVKDLINGNRLEECYIKTIRGKIDSFDGWRFYILGEDDGFHVIHKELIVEMHEVDVDKTEPSMPSMLKQAEKRAIKVAFRELQNYCKGSNTYYCTDGQVGINELKDKLLSLYIWKLNCKLGGVK